MTDDRFINMSSNIVVLSVLVFSAGVFSQYMDGDDDGFFQECGLELVDFTFPKDITDTLIISIVRHEENLFKRFAISRAVDILADPDFNITRKTVLYAHGYGDLPGSKRHPVLTAYLKKEYNVLVLNSMSMISDALYLRSARAVRYVGMRTGAVLAQMERAGLNMKGFVMIGHSLGAHISGFIGKSFFKSSGKKLPTIVGLDPAGPCFRHADSNDRLDKSDAKFVQVMHTNGGGYGLVSPIGHVDFYVNGGRWQPPTFGIFCLTICSHMRPGYLWQAALEAPEGTGFIGVECISADSADKHDCYSTSGEQRTAIMGPTADPKIKGIFYVRTVGKPPFYLGKEGTKPPKTKTKPSSIKK